MKNKKATEYRGLFLCVHFVVESAKPQRLSQALIAFKVQLTRIKRPEARDGDLPGRADGLPLQADQCHAVFRLKPAVVR